MKPLDFNKDINYEDMSDYFPDNEAYLDAIHDAIHDVIHDGIHEAMQGSVGDVDLAIFDEHESEDDIDDEL